LVGTQLALARPSRGDIHANGRIGEPLSAGARAEGAAPAAPGTNLAVVRDHPFQVRGQPFAVVMK
jgi:hypothetical protein